MGPAWDCTEGTSTKGAPEVKWGGWVRKTFLSELEAGWATAGHPHQDCKPDPCPLCLQFAIFLSLIMLVEVAAAIAGYVFRDKVSRAKGRAPPQRSGCSGMHVP